jgi:UDP-glucose 4-epimerase
MSVVCVTGGLGYIGSHTVVVLCQHFDKIIIIDNLSNTFTECLDRLHELVDSSKILFLQSDITDYNALKTVFTQNKIDSVIHFAALKSVGESVSKPLDYYEVNVMGTVNLLRAMKDGGCKKIIYSSSACTYGNWGSPYREDDKLEPINPYGRTKVICESILKDYSNSDSELEVMILRYFNPVGAHESGKIGEYPTGIPNNLVPYIQKVVLGELPKLRVFGNDYDTKDGTPVRDYIHVMDLAEGHVLALNHLKQGVQIYNLGTGIRNTVIDVIKAYEEASGKAVPYEIVGRRDGDAEVLLADPSKANRELGWVARKTLVEMCRDSYNWISNNPRGFTQN